MPCAIPLLPIPKFHSSETMSCIILTIIYFDKYASRRRSVKSEFHFFPCYKSLVSVYILNWGAEGNNQTYPDILKPNFQCKRFCLEILKGNIFSYSWSYKSSIYHWSGYGNTGKSVTSKAWKLTCENSTQNTHDYC